MKLVLRGIAQEINLLSSRRQNRLKVYTDSRSSSSPVECEKVTNRFSVNLHLHFVLFRGQIRCCRCLPFALGPVALCNNCKYFHLRWNALKRIIYWPHRAGSEFLFHPRSATSRDSIQQQPPDDESAQFSSPNRILFGHSQDHGLTMSRERRSRCLHGNILIDYIRSASIAFNGCLGREKNVARRCAEWSLSRALLILEFHYIGKLFW